jgi:hypothetical protein
MSSGTRSTPDSSFEDSKWLDELYDSTNYSQQWISDTYNEYKYQGFIREDVLDELRSKFSDTKLAAKIIMVCALRGPVRAANTQVDGKTLIEWGVPIRRRPGTKGLSCGRITSATADLAAYLLKKANVPKRLSMDCPSWLQFPSAGSIKMPDEYRRMHKEFSMEFSKAIGGEFKEEIYIQMVANSYLDESLNLF